jgi:CheY-like chemotaxis protein
MVDRDEFKVELRRALNHFYDPGYLQDSPLIECLGILEGDPVEGLRMVLRRAIEAFRPAADVPETAKEHRIYSLLHNRYIRQKTQETEATRLGITVRHLRREQSAALGLLVDHLDMQFDLFPAGPRQSEETHDLRVRQCSAELNREMLWLADSQRHETCQVDTVLQEALDLARSLANERGVALRAEPDGASAEVAIPGTVLQQVVLNLLTAAIQHLEQGGVVQVAAKPCQARVTLSVIATARDQRIWGRVEGLEAATLVSRQLVELFGGRLALCEMDKRLVVQVIVPKSQKQLVVLAVEDNEETLRLWSRFVRGTSFTLVKETDPTNALAKAMDLRPKIIILDVMMPGIDGWTLLRQLRDEPLTSRIPIIICTVLPQRDLALSLGASDFVQKPATGQDFRSALERQIGMRPAWLS